LPDGLRGEKPVQTYRQKYTASHFTQIRNISIASRFFERGVSRSSRTWEAGCDGRFGGARRAALMRTAKSCGPDAPTLALSSSEVSDGRRWQQGPVTEEITKETVKTMARGMPGVQA